MNKTIFLGLLFVAAVLVGCAATDENVAGGAINVKTGEQVQGNKPALLFYDGSNIQTNNNGMDFKVKDKLGTKEWHTMTLDRKGNLHVPGEVFSEGNSSAGGAATSCDGDSECEMNSLLSYGKIRSGSLDGKSSSGYICADVSGTLFRTEWPCTGNSNISKVAEQEVINVLNKATIAQKGPGTNENCNDACTSLRKTCVHSVEDYVGTNGQVFYPKGCTYSTTNVLHCSCV